MARLSSEQKLLLIQKVLKEGKSVYSVCRQAGISRKTFYSWLNKFKANKKNRQLALINKNPGGRTHWKALDYKTEQQILSQIHKNPDLSCHKLQPFLASKGLAVGHHGVQNVLEKNKLSTFQRRLAFSGRLFYHRFGKIERSLIVNQIIARTDSVKLICERFGVSRKLAYKWLKRYKESGQILESLTDKVIEGEKHWRWIGEQKVRRILDLVAAHPEWSVHKIYAALPLVENKPIVGHHGIQNVLFRYGLNTYDRRLAWVRQQEAPMPTPKPVIWSGPALKTLRFLISPFTTIPKLALTSFEWLASFSRLTFGVPVIGTILGGFVFGIYEYFILLSQASSQTKVGLIFATFALFFGLIFFLYSLKYYIAAILVLLIPGKEKGQIKPGLVADTSNLKLETYPFVSIHIPLYNEKKVVERILTATLAQEYPADKFEIIVCDDSNDGTTDIVQKFIDSHIRENSQNISENSRTEANGKPMETNERIVTPVIKLIHRDTREGFKGGALREALRASNPAVEYIVVFDADFIPFPDTITQFVKYFHLVNANSVAAIQGYQWHVLNKSENWITRGVRTEYAGNYVVERSATEIYSGLKMIAGSVYCIRRKILDQFGWGTSITEDFQLTLRLYQAGYKVVYTPYIQTPAEAVSTIRRLVRQRMRWAEGHTYNIKKNVLSMMNNAHLTAKEKFEFAYLAPYYLQAAFFIIGTFSWFISEAVLHTRLPFWTATFGWSLVLTNFLALPLINTLGLFLEEGEKKDYLGILSFIVLSYIVTPFAAYAAVKGLLEKQEGPWFRTPKTGLITDVVGKIKLGFWWRKILPWSNPAPAAITRIETNVKQMTANELIYTIQPPFAHSHQFAPNSHKFARKFISKSILAFLLIITLSAGSLSLAVPQTYATNRGADYGQYTDVYCLATDDCKISYRDVTNSDLRMSDCDNSTCSSGGDRAVDTASIAVPYTSIYCPATDDCKISYFTSTGNDLNFADCEDVTCNISNLTTVDSTGTVGAFSSIYCLSTTDCKISYSDDTNADLKFADCDNATCSTNTLTIADSAIVGQWTSIYCPATDDCKIAYYADNAIGGGPQDLKFADCGNATCSTVTLVTVDSTGDVGQHTSVYCPAANDCKISYYDFTNGDLKFVDCNDVDCHVSGGPPSSRAVITTIDSTGDVGKWTSIYCISSTDCKISYYDLTNGDLKMVDCDNTDCSTKTLTTVDTGGASQSCASGSCVGQYTGIYCISTSDCKISYYDVSNGDLKFFDCDNATCSTGTATTVALTVPEFIGFLVPVAPFLPKAVRKVQDKLKRWRKTKKTWKPKKN